MVALSGEENTAETYYGWIEEIWELDFVNFRIPLFKCIWIDNKYGLKRDNDRMLLADFRRQAYKNDPFILAKHAKQVIQYICTILFDISHAKQVIQLFFNFF